MRITRLRYWLACLLLGNGGAALAAWSSGGGILTKDDHNPWFIQNTKEATYCIVRDVDHFKIDEAEGEPLDSLIRKALKYWKDNFVHADYDGPDMLHAQIATQKFVETTDCENADIRFQFGYLSPAQLDEMKKRSLDPQDYFSLAVRTDYDQVNLRGKGFVYLAADSGALRPNSNEMDQHPWAEYKGALTYKVLVHELGHVFGFQHQGNAFDRGTDLMAENYPQNLLEGRIKGRSGFSLPSFLRYKQPETNWEKGQDCTGYRTEGFKFYGLNIDNEGACFLEELRNGRLEVYTFTTPGTKTLAGFADLGGPQYSRYELVVGVWLSKKQKVLDPVLKDALVAGAFRVHEYYKGVYKNLSGSVEREISVYRSPTDWNRVGGVLDGKELIFAKYGR